MVATLKGCYLERNVRRKSCHDTKIGCKKVVTC